MGGRGVNRIFVPLLHWDSHLFYKRRVGCKEVINSGSISCYLVLEFPLATHFESAAKTPNGSLYPPLQIAPSCYNSLAGKAPGLSLNS